MGATFNLNAGLMGRTGMIGRIGNLGLIERSEEEYRKSRHVLPYHQANRIPADEVREVYDGFEVASHAFHHENLKKLDVSQARESIEKDHRVLTELFGSEIIGFAYPYGAYTAETDSLLKQSGIRYARTVAKAKDFHRPTDLLHIPMTESHTSAAALKRVQDFLDAPLNEDDLFFLMFAHGYEFDFGTKESNWEKLRRICDLVRSDDSIICCSTAEALGITNHK